MKREKKRFALAFVLILAVCVLLGKLLFTNEKPVSVAGYSFFIVTSASMEPEYRVRTLVIIKNEPFSRLNVGDTVVYKSDALNGGLAFHRITRISDEGFYTKGDNNGQEDNQLITEETYVGRGIAKIYSLGLYITAIQSPAGFVVFFLLPAFAVILLVDLMQRLMQRRRKV